MELYAGILEAEERNMKTMAAIWGVDIKDTSGDETTFQDVVNRAREKLGQKIDNGPARMSGISYQTIG